MGACIGRVLELTIERWRDGPDVDWSRLTFWGFIDKDSDRYKVANCTQAQPFLCGLVRVPHGKIISVSLLSVELRKRQSKTTQRSLLNER